MSTPSQGSDPNLPPEGAQPGQPGWASPQQPPQGYGQQYPPPQGYGQQGYQPAPQYAGGPGHDTTVMPFPDAVRSVLTQYAVFTGRARRSEYWWFALASFGASLLAGVIDTVIGVQLFQWVLALAVLLPSLAVAVRRLHDTGKSGWWLLIALVPLVGFIVLLVFFTADSDRQPNRWGPSPKYRIGAY